MFEQSGNFHFINLTSRHERGAAVNTAPSFYIAIPANTLLWHAVLFHYYYMYRAFADAEGLGSLPHRGVVVDDIVGYPYSSFFNIVFQRKTPQDTFLQCMKVSEGL